MIDFISIYYRQEISVCLRSKKESILKWLKRHKQYTKGKLEEGTFETDPFSLFNRWWKDTKENRDNFSHMVLSTVSKDNIPHSRIVLLKRFSDEGFVFFTNYLSRKGSHIKDNKRVALNFFSPYLDRQVVIQGRCKKLPKAASDAYFSTRPLDSQIGAHVSQQSRVIASRAFLLNEFSRIKKKYRGKSVPRPSWWGGYLVVPQTMEFWQGRPYRLNDRILFSKTKQGWRHVRLSP